MCQFILPHSRDYMCKISIKVKVATAIAKMKYSTERNMKLQQLHKVDSECKLNLCRLEHEPVEPVG